MKTIIAKILCYTAWPALLAFGLVLSGIGMVLGKPLLFFNIAYFTVITAILLLERFMPFEYQWQEHDHETPAHLLHTLSSKGTVQGLLLFGGIIGLTELITPVSVPSASIWPREWPMFLQVILGLISAEFMLYWAHRLAHEHDLIWRFHAVHHSVKKLWVINTGRFHFLESTFKIVFALSLLVVLGAPFEVVQWISVFTAFIGLLTHCNIDVKTGFLSYIFNTPNLHRWHHSMDLREGNKNYGENLVLWDMLFGTYFNEHWRRPPAEIGIHDYMPPRFLDQILYPFRRAHYQEMGGDPARKESSL
ncbi:MAG: sterol desaturase family protein [Alphaproteobacteria bacterium]|nr:sterol desaturase family protein [Alphaproteobacteria bacterium]